MLADTWLMALKAKTADKNALSNEGAEAFPAFRSYPSTAAKQGVNPLEALRQPFNYEPWTPAAPDTGP
ncbi:MAG: hypothetical protein ACP5P1_10540 [Acidimicrobiales bacterium]